MKVVAWCSLTVVCIASCSSAHFVSTGSTDCNFLADVDSRNQHTASSHSRSHSRGRKISLFV